MEEQQTLNLKLFSASVCLCRSDNKVMVHFINRDGEKITVKGSPGDTLLDVVINEDLDFDGFGTKPHTHWTESYTEIQKLWTVFSHSLLNLCIHLCFTAMMSYTTSMLLS